MKFEDKVNEVARKPSTEISLADADEVQATEVSSVGRNILRV
jgi:hypothetical protein